MKVSNRSEIQKIYQEQIKKAQGDKGGDAFKKVMQSQTSPTDAPKKVFHPPSGIDISNPLIQGKPIPAADPARTLEFAAEVVANELDVRQEKVDRIKKLFDSGQYNIPAEDVAEKLFASGVLTSSWEG